MTDSFPSGIKIKTSRFGLQTNTRAFVSPLSGDTQRVVTPGARWLATYTLTPMNQELVAPIRAFLCKLEGGKGTFYGYDPDSTTPVGVGTGTPLVNGASQTGSSIITDGWTPSVTGILKAGDYFSVNDELKVVTADANSDGSGNCTISFKPALRSSPADNAAITVNTPKCIMRLIDDNQVVWDTNENGIHQVSFSAIETFFS